MKRSPGRVGGEREFTYFVLKFGHPAFLLTMREGHRVQPTPPYKQNSDNNECTEMQN